jgi:crotonobetainyl-CoA:carnitine CoA-transferase CaiB-like acyl-CoA transferase
MYSFDSAIASLANQATNWLIGGQLPKSSGSLHPNIAPYGELFDTKDKQKITFAIGSNKQFRQLCDIIRCKSLATDPRYMTNQQRLVNRTQLYAILYDYIRQFNFKELYEACLKYEVPIGKIRNLKEVFELPEAQAMIRGFRYNKVEIKTVSGSAFRFLK